MNKIPRDYWITFDSNEMDVSISFSKPGHKIGDTVVHVREVIEESTPDEILVEEVKEELCE